MVSRSLRVGGTLRRFLVLVSSALLIGMLVGSNASTAATPPHTRQSIAQHILDGMEAEQEDIFPDPFAVEFGRQFGSSPKASERQVAAMAAAMLLKSAA